MDAQRSRDKWNQWTSEDIQKYLDKYANTNSLGRRSSRRIKKIKFLREVQHQREKVVRLLTQTQ